MNPYLIIGALAAVIVSFLGGGWVGYDLRAGKVPAELLAQQSVDTKACEATQQLTKMANDDLQKDRDSIAAELSAISMRKPTACVSVARKTKPANGSAAGYAANNVSSDWLLSFAATCETYRRAIITANQFLDEERSGKENQAK